MKDYLDTRARRLQTAWKGKRDSRLAWWVIPVTGLLGMAAALAALFLADRAGYPLFRWNRPAQLGHVVRAYGTVKRVAWISEKNAESYATVLDEAWSRLETGRSILVPLRSGDVVQTGEDSATEILFFGGNILKLEAGTLARFEDAEDEVTVRLILGRAYLELPESEIRGKRFIYRKLDGSSREIPPGRNIVLSLSTAAPLNEATDIEEVETDEAADAFASVELRFLAHGEEVLSRHALIVPPIEDNDRIPGSVDRSMGEEVNREIEVPEPVFPGNDADVDVELINGISFQWNKIEGSSEDPVVAYEIIVRPAPGYEVEDTARKVQVFRGQDPKFPIETVNGGGVFLWSVRAVTASGQRGPASAPRWLEIKFPKRLRPPKIKKPKVE